MFVGHYAFALAAKRAAPNASLGTAFLAAQFLDLLWPVLLLSGIEHVRIAPGATAFTPLDFYDYPISHSLVMVAIWSSLFGAIYFLTKRDRRTAVVLAICVLNHWILDFISHRSDMPLVPGVDRYVGLGLWNSVTATVIVELALLVIGLVLFLRTSKPNDSIGRWSFWAFVAFTVALYAGSVLGGPPPNVNALAWFGLAQWIMVPWAYWIDRHRASSRMEMVRTHSA